LNFFFQLAMVAQTTRTSLFCLPARRCGRTVRLVKVAAASIAVQRQAQEIRRERECHGVHLDASGLRSIGPGESAFLDPNSSLSSSVPESLGNLLLRTAPSSTEKGHEHPAMSLTCALSP